jgi:hypothetical protein
MKRKSIPRLAVVFDTNVLFTQVASDLVRNDVQRIVLENSNHPDLAISWYLPEIVIGERRYQMLGKAKELLPNMQKMEKLLGHNFGVGENTLEIHVDRAIDTSIEKCKFQIAALNTTDVDWTNLILRSVNRKPPFEVNEREKGFRDAIIAHSFLQLCKSSPSTPSVCRLALVSEDQRLREYVSELTTDAKNIRVLKGLDELESLINTLVSTIPEEFAAELAQKAGKIFFEKENNKSFYYKENIGEKIREQYSKELNDSIIPGHLRSGGTWWISGPIFIKKERQRVHWVSMVEPEFEVYHYELAERGENALLGLAGMMGSQSSNTLTNALIAPPVATPGGLGRGFLGEALPSKKIVDLKGKEKFEVHWSTSLSQAQNLTSPKLEKIQYVGNNVNESSS